MHSASALRDHEAFCGIVVVAEVFLQYWMDKEDSEASFTDADTGNHTVIFSGR